jgi:Tol biopolymer transport system component
MMRSHRTLLFALIFFVFLTDYAFSQAFSFGKNRVQYETFDWRIIQSEHFDIYYYDPRNYYLAEFSAYALEAAYLQLKTDFRHEINDRIRVIVYDSHSDFSQTNVVPLPVNAQGIGGVTDLFKNRITIPFMADYNDFRRVLHHELVHAIVNDMYYGGNINILLSEGRRIFPLWFEEGLAEYTALGWDTNTDMFMRDAVINTYLPPIPFLGGYFAYRGGQAVWDFIVQQYGREKIGEIMQRTKTHRNFELALRQSLGLTLDELSERWHDWLKTRYWPEVAERENLRQISFFATEREYRGNYNTSPAISPQGDRIAFITNRRGFFDVVVMNAIDGRHIKTLVRGEDNVDFEELNILRPNLAWSPDGRNIALSTTSRGKGDIAIVDYQTGKVRKLQFPDLDAIRSVAWSPDGKKIAFQASRGSFPDIYVYDLESGDFFNVTNDVFSDFDPAWSYDSQSILFASDRGSRVELGTYRENYFILANPNLGQTDLYKVRLGEGRATRLTNTAGWIESRPIMVNENTILYLSDQNGITNIYSMNLNTRVSRPLTNLVTGVMQMSATRDGSKVAVNSINGGFLDIFVIQNPLNRAKSEDLTPNLWAQRRTIEAEETRVPALRYGRNFFVSEFRSDGKRFTGSDIDLAEAPIATDTETEVEKKEEEESDPPTTPSRPDVIDFRNFVFSEELEEEFEDPSRRDLFQPENNRNEEGLFIPRRKRLTFTPDFSYASASFGTYYGAFTFSQISVSDVLGYHRLSFATNLVFDLRNSNYFLGYAYLRNRTNYFVTYSHSAWQFQNFFGEVIRYRNYGMSLALQYPLNRFERLEVTTSMLTVSREANNAIPGLGFERNDTEYLLFPQLSYVRDVTIPGFLTPQKGNRLAVGISGSPKITDEFLGFVTLSADVRQYVSLGRRYTLAFRLSGASSFGPDTQQFLLGGMGNWINYRVGRQLTDAEISNLFFTIPAMPMRGYAYNQGIGDKFVLGNAEFRFPLFAALIPGPIPLFPLFNIQGAAFVDVGSTWTGATYNETLVGSGFGLRTILLGLPFRYDVGWPYDVETGRFGSRIHYFSIGIDF